MRRHVNMQYSDKTLFKEHSVYIYLQCIYIIQIWLTTITCLSHP